MTARRTPNRPPPFRALTAWVTGGDMHNHTRHRNVQGGASRAAVLGAGDGLITNVSLILGVAGASTAASPVRLAGVAGLLAGAFSMAAGELVSVRAQDELVQRELQVERQELTEHPNAERRELAAMYRAQGVSAEDAETVAGILSRYEQAAFETHARLELGVDPKAGGSAVQASVASFLSFAIGAFLPLIPWLFSGGHPAPGECPDRGPRAAAATAPMQIEMTTALSPHDGTPTAHSRSRGCRDHLRSRAPAGGGHELTVAAWSTTSECAMSGGNPGQSEHDTDRPRQEQRGDNTPTGDEKPDKPTSQHRDLPEMTERESQRNG